MLKGYDMLRGYLLGEHLSHSFSPSIHAMLSDYSYGIKEIAPSDLEMFMKDSDFDFLNVTIPYKKQIISYLSSLSEEAKTIGAVNTVKKMPDGSLVGFNTDYFGFELLLEKSGIDVADKKILVLGSGGASMPVKAVLEAHLAKEIVVISRHGDNNYKNLFLHKDADVIINTTPVGMYPDNGQAPLSLEMFEKLSGVIDIIYNPAYTQLLLDAESKGIPNIGGLYMLVAQAKKAAEIFTGCMIDDTVIDTICKDIEAKTKNIVLIGMPGCGKSTVGKLLAQNLGRKFYDTDEVFFDIFGVTPAEVITADGEDKFRAMEHEVVRGLGKLSGAVLSTGGGVVTREENYPDLHQNGVVFFIDRDIKNLPTQNRPLSKSVGLDVLYNTRYPMYMRFCDHKIVSNEIIQDTVNKIIRLMMEGK